jgi:D-psicose/D-tagatose/L-ribulose 3-epimerase
MRIGINTFLFTSPFTDRSTALFAKFRRWGFDSVEIAVEDPAHINPTFIKLELARHKLVSAPVCACFPPDRDLRGTASQQRNTREYLFKLIDMAATLDAPCVAGPLYSATGRADAVAPREQKKQWATVVKNLKVICRYAEKRGKFIAMEPLNRFETDFLNTVEQGLRMIRDVGSPALKLHLDTFHMNIEEKSQAAAIRRAGKYLGHFHACGSDRGTPGGDHTDWPGIAAALKAVGYKGDAVIESFTQDVQVIARAAAIWRKIEPSREQIAVDGLKFLRRAFR